MLELKLSIERGINECLKVGAWSSLVEGGEGSYLPNCQTTLVIALYALSQLFCIFMNITSYHLGRYEPSAPWLVLLHNGRNQYFSFNLWINVVSMPSVNIL